MAFFIIPGDLEPYHTGKYTTLRVCSSRKGTDRLLRKVVQVFHQRSVGPERGHLMFQRRCRQQLQEGAWGCLNSKGLGALADIIQFHVTILIVSFREKVSNTVILWNVSRSMPPLVWDE